MNDKAIPRPVRRGPYVPVFRPEGDVYEGVDTPSFLKGTFYPRWIVNDFSAVRYRGAWHLIGITHPEPPGMTDEFVYDPATVHEAEYQLFHASARGERFAELMRAGSFTEEPKILYPQMRPGERPDLWAPHALAFHDGIRIVYSPGEIRCADSTDFRSWQTGRVLFRGEDDFARDPFLYSIREPNS